MKKITLFLSFIFCLYSAQIRAQVPANDICSGAETLSVGSLNTCDTPTLVTIDNNLSDSGEPDPGCAAYNNGPDVWYKLKIPASGSVRVETSIDDGSITDTGMVVYTGNCNNLSYVDCDDDIIPGGSNLFSGISVTRTPDTEIFIRVWRWGNTPVTGTFNICAYELPPVAVADNFNCETAIDLTPGALCNPEVFTNNSVGTSLPGDGTLCGDFNGGDVWFRVQVPTSGHLIFETKEDDLSITDGDLAVYSGTCEPLNLLFMACSDDDQLNENTIYSFGRIELTELTEDEFVYIRFWSNRNVETGSFEICVINPEAMSVEEFNVNNLRMFPNPVSHGAFVTLQSKNFNNQAVDIQVVNIQGKRIMTQQVVAYEGKIRLDINQLNQGLYFVNVKVGTAMVTKKMIVK